MDEVFADTFYWIALIHPRDQSHQLALETSKELADKQIITTENVLEEVLNFFSGMGSYLRANTSEHVRAILENANVK